MLKIGLLFGVFLIALLAMFFFGRPQFRIGLVLLAALVELGLSSCQGRETGNDRPGDLGRNGLCR